MAGDNGVFPDYFSVLSLVFELKHNCEVQPYPEKNPEPPKRVKLLWISMGKIITVHSTPFRESFFAWRFTQKK